MHAVQKQIQNEQRDRKVGAQAQGESQKLLDVEERNQELQKELESLRTSYNAQQEIIQNFQESQQNHQKLTDDIENLKAMLSSILSSNENFKIDSSRSTDSTLESDVILTQGISNEDSGFKGEMMQIGEFTVLNLLHQGD